MANHTDPSQYRPVNAMLGSQPRVGLLPANQLFPWTVISLGLWLIANLISLPGIWTVLLIFWGDVTWWLLTGKTPWRFLSKFVGVPNLTRGRVTYRSINASMPSSQVTGGSTKRAAKSQSKPTSKKQRPKK